MYYIHTKYNNLIKFDICTFAYQAVKDHSLLKLFLIENLTNSNVTRFCLNHIFFNFQRSELTVVLKG